MVAIPFFQKATFAFLDTRIFKVKVNYRAFLMACFLTLVLTVCNTRVYANSYGTRAFFGDHFRGWHWYETLPLPEEAGKQPDQAHEQKAPHVNPSPKSPTEMIKAYREELESRLHAAWVHPTPQNIKAYQEMQKDMMDRSKLFSTLWLQTVFQNPGLDHTLVSPVNQQARHLQIDLEKNSTFKVIKGLSETYGLFFFFSNDCPYCHQFAPIVKRFAETYGWEVVAIRVGDSDGNTIPEFPNAEPDNGLFQAWDIKVLPSLFAVNPITREAIPVAYGLTSLDEMENRIVSLVGDPK